MGYQVAVTPLQMVAAVSSVANGGVYVEPRIIRAIYRDGRRYQVPPKALRRTVSADTAATLTAIMEQVVSDGTAKRAQIDGFTSAGKTGTAQKLINGRYSHNDHNASFVGFLPSRDPVVAIIVVIDSPHAGPTTGGGVSAPVFKRIAEATMRYLGVPPNINPAPAVLLARSDAASNQAPSPQQPNQPVVSFVADAQPGTLPDLRGQSARDAVRALVKLGVHTRISGDGFVVAQEPPAGTAIAEGMVCRLTLDRSPARQHSTAEGQP
jgi:membrane peptidoglycan carboxypeptidase